MTWEFPGLNYFLISFQSMLKILNRKRDLLMIIKGSKILKLTLGSVKLIFSSLALREFFDPLMES